MARFTVEDRGQIAADRKRRRKKRPPTESEVVDHLWRQAKATAMPPGPPWRPKYQRLIQEAKDEKRQAREDKRQQAIASRTRYKTGREVAAERPMAYTRERPGMPASILRTPEAEHWQAVHHDPGSWGGALLDAMQLFAKTGEIVVDFGTGIPTLIRDPSVLNLGIVGATFIPGVGKVFRVLKGGAWGLTAAEQGMRVARVRPLKTRTLRLTDDVETVIPGASAETGNAVERVFDRTQARLFPGLQAKKAAHLEAKSIERRHAVMSAGATVIDRVARKLNRDQKAALLFYAENSTLAERIAYHTDRARELVAQAEAVVGKPRRILREQAASHIVLVKLAKNSARYLDDAPDGMGVVMRADAPQKLKDAWRAIDEAGALREDIVNSVNPELAAAMAERVHSPARELAGQSQRQLDIFNTSLGPDPSGFGPAADARLSYLDRALAAFEEKVARKLFIEGSDQKWRNMANARMARGASRLPTVTEDALPEARAWIDDMIARADTPEARQLKEMYDEQARLRARAAAHAEDFLSGRPSLAEAAPRGLAMGRRYMLHEYGIPGGDIRRRVVRAITHMNPRNVQRLVANDPSLRKAWEGDLMRNGTISTDATGLTIKSLLKATKIDALQQYRTVLLKVSTPERVLDTDIPILADLADPTVSTRVRQLMRIGAEGETPLSKGALIKLADDDIDAVRSAIIGSKGEELGKNVRWINQELFDALTVEASQYRLLASRPNSAIARLTVAAVENLNDLQRFAVLYANPFGYGVTNLLSNAVFALMEQGVLALPNAVRAFTWAKKLTPLKVAMMDAAVGAGGIRSVFTAKGAVRHLTSRYTEVLHNVVDLIPRRMALIHELRREGIRTPEEFSQLLDEVMDGSESAWQKLDRAAYRGADALGDYNLASPAERAIVARIFFVWPWVRAATRLTYRFPLEHPFQAAGFGYLGAKQYQNRPEGPWYTEANFMIPEQFPWLGGKAIDPSTVLAFKTPFDFGRAVLSIGLDRENAPELLGEFNPFIQAGIAAVTGSNEFGQELEGSPIEILGRQMLEQSRPYLLYEQWTTPEEERKDRLYPYTQGDLILRAAIGSIAPREFNLQEAASRKAEMEARSKPKPPEFSTERKLAQWAKDHPEQFDQAYVPYIVKYREISERVRAGKDALAKSEGLSGRSKLSKRQEAAVELNVLLEVRPDLFEGVDTNQLRDQLRRVFERGLSDDIEEYMDALRGLLAFEDVLGARINTIVKNAQQYLKDRAKATRLAG